MPADVQVIVHFKERCVFAGEELNCSITFRNHVAVPEVVSPGLQRHDIQSRRGGLSRRGHAARKAFNLTLPRDRQQASSLVNSPPLPNNIQENTTIRQPDIKHQRAVSVVSVNTKQPSSPPIGDHPGDVHFSQGASRGHRRSSTVQHIGDTNRRNLGARQTSFDRSTSTREGRRSPLSISHSPAEETTPTFKFPPEKYATGQMLQPTSSGLASSNLPQRIISDISNNESNRESIDLYNHSNNSGETLISEQPSTVAERPSIPRNFSNSLQRSGSLAIRRPQAVRLLMGYAQISATFTLDSSLVDQTPFEEVKRKGFLGGQAGGGVVGVKKKTRPSTSLFGAFNFSSLGESLDSILGGDNLSSVKEMKAVTSSRAVPLLSTPQSLLFVDLYLEPGEERSYSFTFRLPKGLPSSYKGKAIKIVYNLTIGVQGSPGKKEMQAVRQVNIPIRVFSGVDIDGEIFGHDLMQPYVILQDTAETKLLDPSSDEANSFAKSRASMKTTAKEFLQQVDTLLEVKRRRQSSIATIDMISDPTSTQGNATTRAINRAIMHSNQTTTSTSSSPNRFEIARSGLKIAIVTLDRPLHRLGETLTVVIDFSHSEMSCASLRCTLETTESVSAELAIRSASTLSRITRKIYASQSENILFSKRAAFCATIPATATPSFVTSGVNLDWCVKLEFGTVRNDEGSNSKLLEEIMQDERGKVSVAVESLECDSFEVGIPLTVYGDVVMDGKDNGGEVVGISI